MSIPTPDLHRPTQTPDSDDGSFKSELLGLIPFLRAFARSLTGNQEGADDLAQETLVKAWQSRATFIPGTNLKAWLFTILRNQFYSDRRRAWRQAPWDQEAAERIPGGGEDQIFSAQLSDTARALRCLSDEQREALILVGAGGFSYEDAAAICKCAVGTVKSRVARARKALMEILDGDDTLGDVARPAGGEAAREIMAQLDRLSPPPQRPGASVENDVQNSALQEPLRSWTLRQRLLLIITLALLPIALVSVLQGIDRARRDITDVADHLVQSARTAAEGEQSLLQSGEQILRAVGSLKDVREVGEDCDGDLADAMIGVDYFNNLSRIDNKGTVVCSALPLAKGLNVSDLQLFRDLKTAGRTMVVSPQLISRATGQPVIGAMAALRKPDGSFDGSVGIALDVHWFNFLLRSHPIPEGAVETVFDSNGAVLAANDFGVAAALSNAALKAGAPDGVAMNARDLTGQNWHFAITRLPGKNLFVIFAEREDRLFSQTYLHVGIDFLLPIFMILVAWGAIWFATDRQVTQWIAYLRRIAVAYRSGHYTIRPDLADAPTEFRLLGDAMSEMAEGIQDRDLRLRELVNLKTTLIKEIHHRVKNNLQIVMSLLSLQANQVKDAGAREALMQAQTRINALALVHRILNELEDQSTLDLKQLLEELSHQIAEGMSDPQLVRIQVDVPHRVVASSVAVALALFTVEALTNIFKHAFPGEARGVITVSMAEADAGNLRLSIADDGIGFAMDETGKSVGSRLIRTFGVQLGGVSSVKSAEGRGTVVELVFPDPALKAS